MRYNFLTTFLTLMLLLAPYASAHAQTVLFFAPTRVNIDDQNPVQEIRVTNMSEIVRSYSISLKNITMNEGGQTVAVDNFEYSAKRMLRFVPRNFDIQPGKKQIIRIMARFPEGTTDGEYHAHLEFLENLQKRAELNPSNVAQNRAHMNAQISYVTAIPVIISKGEVNTDIAMSDLEIGTDKNGRPSVSMVFTRNGNGQGNAYIEADYISPDGKETKAAVRRSVYIYRELNRREHSFLLELMDSKDLQKGGQIRVKLFNRDISIDEPVDTVLLPLS